MKHPAERLLGPMSEAELRRIAIVDKALPQLRASAEALQGVSNGPSAL